MITQTEIRYDFTITTKPDLDSGRWHGHGLVHYVDEDLTFDFVMHRDGRTGWFHFYGEGDPTVETHVKDDLKRILSECYDSAIEQARERFASALYDAGAGSVSLR
jgi:hypothetical protein